MNETKVQASINRIVAGINTEFDAMDDTDRGTLLANLTISLFRTCERELDDLAGQMRRQVSESVDRILDASNRFFAIRAGIIDGKVINLASERRKRT